MEARRHCRWFQPHRTARVHGFACAVAFTAASAHAQSIARVDVANDGSESSGGVESVDVSDDGTRVVFSTSVDGLDPADSNGRKDVYLRDLVAGTTTLLSVKPNGAQVFRDSFHPRISGDGRFVAFESAANNLVDGDTNGLRDVFLRDLAAGTTTRVSVAWDGSENQGVSTLVAISGDGGRVLFSSHSATLVPGDTNRQIDLFLRDVAAGTTTRVDVAADGTEADLGAIDGDMSRDGQVVLIISDATNLVADDTNGARDVFVHDLVAGTVVRASVDANGGELEDGIATFPDGFFQPQVLSPDGTCAAFACWTPLDPADVNDVVDVFSRDLAAGTTTACSVDSEGDYSAAGFGSFPTGISSDHRFFLLEGDAVTLAADDGAGFNDVYVRDSALTMTTRSSNGPDGVGGDGSSHGSRMSADGRFVVFVSDATDLVAGRTTAGSCAFLLTRPLHPPSSAEYGEGLAGTNGIPVLAVEAEPLLNQPCDVAVGNSSGAWTVALLLIGTESADVPTRLGGDLLVVPTWTSLLAVAPEGDILHAVMSPDERLASIAIVLQVLELDAGAPHGVAFTAGLELRPGF